MTRVSQPTQTPADKIRLPSGKFITKQEYCDRVSARAQPCDCMHGHMGDALWNGGPCSDELLSEIEGMQS